ncbi:MAG: acyl carrier protein [Chloroflexota bacterium]
MDTQNIEANVTAYIREAFLYGKGNGELTSMTELVETGIIDSINVLRLVEFLEEDYDVEIRLADVLQFTTIANISRIIETKTMNNGQ